jgi:hypothetical protein
MRIDQPRQHHPPGKVDRSGARTEPTFQLGIGADCHDAIMLHRQCLRDLPVGIFGVDLAVQEDQIRGGSGNVTRNKQDKVEKDFFFEKKKQKTFAPRCMWPGSTLAAKFK